MEQIISGFIVSTIIGKKQITLKPENLDLAFEIVKEHNIDIVVVSENFWSQFSLRTLLPYKDLLRGICLVDIEGKLPDNELRNLYAFEDLELFDFATGQNLAIDFSHFPSLKAIYVRWSKNFKNLFFSKELETVDIIGYPKEDLSDFSQLKELKELVLWRSKIISLNGLEDLSLTSIDISHNRYLEDIGAIRGMGNSLEKLELECCPKLKNIEAVKSLIGLKKLILINCKEIPSLGPIKELKNLESVNFIGSTNILDGDMSPLIGKGHIAFDNKKHYSHTIKEIRELNAGKKKLLSMLSKTTL